MITKIIKAQATSLCKQNTNSKKKKRKKKGKDKKKIARLEMMLIVNAVKTGYYIHLQIFTKKAFLM